MPNISHNLAQIRQRMRDCAATNPSDWPTPKLLAVSKTQPSSAIASAYEAAQRDFGENYAQELADKAEQLKHLSIVWHFIGPIQSNKTRLIAQHSHWVHSVDRLKIAERLSQQRPLGLAPLQICIQVNIDNAPTKSGVSVPELSSLIAAIRQLPNLEVRGLMAIPDPINAPTAFKQLAALAKEFQLDTLSMGMSDDMEEAIRAGATIVRIGTAIFGARGPQPAEA